jgi:predicted transcriptional regulator YdeE
MFTRLSYATLFFAILISHPYAAERLSALGPCPDASPAEVAQFKSVPVSPPRIEQLGDLKLVGVNVTTAAHQAALFESIDRAFTALSENTKYLQPIMIAPITLPQGRAGDQYQVGVCFTQAGVPGFSFMPSFTVREFSNVPDAMTSMSIFPSKYAVFTYKGIPDGTGDFRFSITHDYFPTTTLKRAPAPNLEIMKAGIDPKDPNQTIEEWYPIE